MTRSVTLVACTLLIGARAFAQLPLPGQPPDQQQPAAWEAGPTRTIELFPSGEIYPVYVADPHRATNVVAIGFYPRVRVPEASSPRWFLAGGGHFGMLRINSKAPGGRFWQVSIDAGLDVLFDAEHKLDGLGWDGNYGLTLTTAAQGSPWGLRLGVLHTSTHLGDEYQERTESQRINYTREEVALGVAWRFRPRWRTYTEVGLAYKLRSAGQDQWRWQGGLEFEARPTVFGGRMAWYGALDFSALEERDWRLDYTLQGGLATRSGGRTYRMFVQWHDGMVPLGQFSQYSETNFSLGFKIDL